MFTDNNDIKSLPVFERLIQPYSNTDVKILTEQLLQSSQERIIHIWNNVHLYDKQRFDICINHNLQYELRNMSFDTHNHAALYICNIQLRRNDLTDEYRKYIIGKMLHFSLANSSNTNHQDAKSTVALLLSKQLFMSAGTVLKYGVYAASLDIIFEQAEDFAKNILQSKVRISHENIIELSHLRSDEMRSVAEAINRDKNEHVTFTYIMNEVKWSHIKPPNSSSKRKRRTNKELPKPAIRQMPQYNPDAEVNSLCMTIDSWISSIQRVNNSDNIGKITNKASLQLMKKLSFLEHTINALQQSLVERTEN